jgi:hypothetical protein
VFVIGNEFEYGSAPEEALDEGGFDIDPDELGSLLVSALRAVLPRHDFEDPEARFTKTEIELLRRGGLQFEAGYSSGVSQSALEAAVEYASVLMNSISLHDAIERTGVSAEEFQQRGAARELILLETSEGSLLPAFQFTRDRQHLLPGLETVMPELVDLDPPSIEAWFETPNDALSIEGRYVTPHEWLERGHDPGPLRALARALTAT